MAPAADELQCAFAASMNTERYLSQLPKAQRIQEVARQPSIGAHWRMQRAHGDVLPHEYFLARRAW